MSIKVVKFGGSSLADATHFKQVAAIIKADNARRYVVPSAPGKRFSGDEKVTDMLYACYNMAKAGENIDVTYSKICDRYNSIIAELGLDFDISGELEYIKNAILQRRSGRDFAASRGEYLNGIILAKYLGFDFIDAESVVFFHENGLYDGERTDAELREELKKHKYAVIPGFYGVMPNGTIKTFSRGGSDITGSIVSRAADAEIYENWTDVSGCLMADPRIVDDPKPIKTITGIETRSSYTNWTILLIPLRTHDMPLDIREGTETSVEVDWD